MFSLLYMRDGLFLVMYALVVKDPLLIDWQAAGIKEAMKKADQSVVTDKNKGNPSDYSEDLLTATLLFFIQQEQVGLLSPISNGKNMIEDKLLCKVNKLWNVLVLNSPRKNADTADVWEGVGVPAKILK